MKSIDTRYGQVRIEECEDDECKASYIPKEHIRCYGASAKIALENLSSMFASIATEITRLANRVK